MSKRKLRFVTGLLSVTVALHASSPAEEIPPPARAGSAEPFLFAAKDSLLLSWLEPVPGSDRVALRFARFAGGSWSEARTISEGNDFFINWADFPSVVEDGHGVVFAHWLQKSGETTYAYDVRMAASADGGRTWGEAFSLNRDKTRTEHGFVTLAVLPGGGVGAAWLDGRNMAEGKEEGEMTLRYAAVDARGRIRSDVQLDGRTCECCATGMTVTPKGAVIVYRDRSAEEIRDIACVRQTANGWTTPRLIHADGWKIAGCPVNGPRIDALGNRLGAAWFTAAQERGLAYVAFSVDAGAHFAKPVRIDDGNPLGRVDIRMLDGDSAVVTWLEQTPSGAEIRARRVSRIGRSDPSVKIADSTASRASGFPRIARVGRDVYCAWTELDGTSKRVHVRRVRF